MLSYINKQMYTEEKTIAKQSIMLTATKMKKYYSQQGYIIDCI